jgi:Na+/melibiose symporter-like transporter
MKSFIDNPGKSFISTNSNLNNNTPDASMENPNISNLIYESEEISEDVRKKTVMVNDINAQLGDFNRKSNYNDTNMVSLSISELAFKEKEGLHSLLTSFIVYSTIIFTTKYINETIFINSNLIIKDNKKDDWKIPLFFGSSCLIVLIIEFSLRKKNKIISEKTFLIIVFFLNLIIDLILFFMRNSSNFIYYLIICLAIIFTNIIEKYAAHFFYSIIPQDYSVCKMQGNMLINRFSMLAKIVSSILLLALSDNDNYNMIIYLTFIILSFICLILFLVFYSDIRIKSISRIMDKLGKNEIKVATEV